MPGLPGAGPAGGLAVSEVARGRLGSLHPVDLQPRRDHRHHGRSSGPAGAGGRVSAGIAHEGQNAIHHLFRVASSLDSMVVGEPQILGQLKTAYGIAKTQGALCGWLEGLLERAFSVAKRVRSETGIGQMAVSVSYAAVELARKIFGSLNNRTVMIAGAGKMSQLAARHLRRSGAAHVFVTNRT